MPPIPTLTQNVQEERGPRMVFSASGHPAAYGGGRAQDMAALGGAIIQAGHAATQIAGEWSRMEEDADLNAAAAEFRAESRTLLTGEKGVLTREGRDATGATTEAGEALARLKAKYASRFASERTRTAWEMWSNRTVEGRLDEVSRHEAVQLRRFHDEAAKARLMSAVDELVESRYNPADAVQYEEEIAALVQEQYGEMGPDVVAQQIAANLNAAHSGVIEAFRDKGEYAQAQEWMTLFGDRLNATYRARHEGDIAKEAKEDELLSKALWLEGTGRPLGWQLTWIKENVKDADEYRWLVNQVEELDTQKTREAIIKEKARETEALTKAFNEWKAGNAMYQFPEGFDNQIQESAFRLRKLLLGGEGVKTDWQRYKELSIQSQKEPDKFRDVNLNAEVHRLEGAELRTLADLQVKTTTEGEWNRDVDIAIFAAYDKIPSEYIEPRATTATAKNEDKRRFRNAVRMALIDAKPGDREALQKAIDAELLKGMEDRPWYKGDLKALKYQVPPESFYVPEAEAPAPPPQPSDLWMGNRTAPAWLRESPTRPATVSNNATLSADGQSWEVIRLGRVVQRWDLQGNPK